MKKRIVLFLTAALTMGVVLGVLAETGSHDKVQLWEGGPYWATTNIGANNPWDYGLYFWWGDTTGYRPAGTVYSTQFNIISFYYDNPISQQTDNKSLATLSREGWIVAKDGTYVLAPSHDAAHVKWGGAWRMPTYQELNDLKSKCDWTWQPRKGVDGYGYVIRGRGDYASNSIFLPAAGSGYGISLDFAGAYGYYWSSVPYPGSYSAYRLYFQRGSCVTNYDNRFLGRSIRPVQDFTNGSSATDSATTGSSAGLFVDTIGKPLTLNVPESGHVATTEAAPVGTAAAEYNGFLKDAAGKIAGSVQLKFAKAGKDGTSKVTGTVQLGSKKEKVSGTYKGGVLTAAGFSNVTLDFNGITATYKTYSVDGARNVFAAKDTASKNQASAAMKAYKGAYTVAWQEGGVWGGVTVTVANKGKAKVAGFLSDGTKVGADGQLMLGEGTACATLVSKNKKTPLVFNLWLTGGAAVVDGLGGGTAAEDSRPPVAAKVGALASGKSFTCSLLGAAVPVTVAGKKWSVTTDKATALKLTFNAKAGSFKGSFKAGKQKVTVNGVVVNGVGYGSAVIKKGAKAAVTIE